VASRIGQELGATPAQVALAWVLHQGLMPVLGARRVDQIRDNLAALDVRLDDDQLARLDAATRVDLGYPHAWLDEDHRRALFWRAALEE
jgi:aryl-alcohol dehydrogenase-like predicted oxidoreductase